MGKKIRRIIIIVFAVFLLLPVLTFNWKENVVSEIDNRELTNNPFGKNAEEFTDLSTEITSYVQDRIGFRDQMILGYTVLNDKLFHKMVHPTYDYGKDGYVFFKGGQNVRFNEYHTEMAKYIKTLQDSCDEKGVPFVFVFNPAKTTVFSDKLREGIHYDAGWVEEFLGLLDAYGVNYVDNTPLLIEKRNNGEMIFNKVYNAGHWNDLGAFYGCNAILENLKEYYPDLHINTKSEYSIEDRLNTSLMVSQFPIHEYEPVFEPKSNVKDISSEYRDLELDEQYRTFGYYVNGKRKEEGAPRALCFQGSYMNGMGYKFLQNSFGEYIYIHAYQNILNFDYYYDIFQPDCVIFETAEYTLTPTYYDLERK